MSPPVPVHLLLVGVDPVLGQIQEETERENKKDKWWRFPPLYLSTSCWLVSTLSSGREEERVRDNTVIQKNYENVPPVPVHLLLVGIDPVQRKSHIL